MVRWILIVILAIFFLFGGYNFKDVGQAFMYFGRNILPSNSTLGIIIFSLILLFVLFTDEILSLLKIGKKIKVKKEF